MRSSASEAADAVRLVRDHQDLDALQLRQLARRIDRSDYAVGHVDDVGLRRLVDVDADRGATVHVSADRELGCDELDRGDIAHPHAAADHQVAHVVERVKLTQRPDDEARAVLGDLAGADREIRRFEQLAQLQHVDAVGSDSGGIDQHAHLARLDALELDARDAVEALDRVLEVLLQRVVLVGEIGVGREPDDHHRLVGSAEGEHQDAIGRRRQVRADRVELGADLEGGLLGVAVPVEEHRELRLVRARGGLDLLDAGQRRERLLDRAAR